MPNLFHLVTSLELSKRLKELGVKQDGLMVWLHLVAKKYNTHTERGWVNRPDSWKLIISRDPTTAFSKNEWVSAYTAGELGEMLKDTIGTLLPFYSNHSRKWEFQIRETGDFRQANTEADSRAKLLIYLLTSNLINVTK